MLSANSTSKFVVEEIAISTEQMQELNRMLKRSGSTTSKYRLIRNVAGGNCSACYGGIPSKKVSYDVGDDSKLIEWYCEDCWPLHKTELDKRLENMNFS